jgi:plasmid stabilization system protein ParE
MPQSRLILSDSALADWEDVERYITRKDGPLSAAAVSQRISRSLRVLADMPGIGRRRQNLVRGDVFFHPISPWIVVYTILPDKDGIYIRRIVDGRRDLKRVL